MKKKFKVLTIAMTAILLVGSLSGCGNSKKKADEVEDLQVLHSLYNKEPLTLDYLVSNESDSAHLFSNCVEGLFENDPDGNIKPALATSWKVSPDGLVYTYKIRQGVKWMNSDGSEYAEVKPSDWVTGLKHTVDKKSEWCSILGKSIKGLKEFVAGKLTNFDQVGIKADDKKGTLTYTLVEPQPYWTSLTLYGCLYPINAEFLKAQGAKFGQLTPDGMLYNGPYILKSYTAKSSYTLRNNPQYWDAKNVHFKELNFNYWSKTDLSLPPRSFLKGESDVAFLNAHDPSWKDVQKKNAKNILTSESEAVTFFASFNLNRKPYQHTIADKDKAGTHQALINKNFRKSIAFAYDKSSCLAQTLGKDGGNKCLRHSIVCGDLVKINGRNYGQALQEEMVRLNPEWKQIDFSQDGSPYPGYPKLAQKYLTKAKKELTAQGVKFPIHLDLATDESDPNYISRANSLKRSVEATLGAKNVAIDIQKLKKADFLNITLLASNSEQTDWDIKTDNGWAPDFLDPAGVLNVFDYRNGGNLHSLGLTAIENNETEYKDGEVVEKVGLKKYARLLDQAGKFTSLEQRNQRYLAYVKAEGYFLDNVYAIPVSTQGLLYLSKIKPFSYANGKIGDNFVEDLGALNHFKYAKLQDHPVTIEEYQQAKKDFLKRSAHAKILGQEK